MTQKINARSVQDFQATDMFK